MMSNVPGTVLEVSNASVFDEQTLNESVVSITFFWASFHEPSKPNGQIDIVFRQLAALHPRIRFLKVDAEALSDITERFEISVVPTFCILQGKSILDKLEGANVSELAKQIQILDKSIMEKRKEAGCNDENTAELSDALTYRLKKLINASTVMLFMKGNHDQPRCGFSKQIISILDAEHVQYGTFDILQDEAVRQGIKKYSNWPTFPQLYVNGALVGGLDILKEMKEEGSVVDQLGLAKNAEEGEEAFQESLKALVQSAKVLVFMKGTPHDPKCGFSRKVVQLLRENSISFSSFDILSDEQVRQGLKKFSDWPTYPQIYVNGQLIGGLDILNDMAEQGDLSEQLGVSKREKRENKYEALINRADVMIFIKGTPKAPQCGFSRQLVEILDREGFSYESFDILSDESIRQGLKKHSNWPTFPQVYIKGKLIGGLDIIQQLQEDNELMQLKP